MKFPAPNLKQYEHNSNKTFTIPFQKSCALVGSGGILLKSNYGELIDQHDLVIRAGIPFIKGYEKHVGSKLDITTINRMALIILVNELTSPKEKSKSYTTRLEQLNNTILWYYLDVTKETRKMLKTLSRKCGEKGLLVHLAFSPLRVRDTTRR